MSYLKQLVAYGLTVALASACNTNTTVGNGGSDNDSIGRSTTLSQGRVGNPAY
ncbi:hypothetical protein FIV00_28315 [Labrenzia sp. THAF82]|uniref:hypothetical protein n=1 Tax=uncultured Roseibium sp. TaxID=1936171 RepID=UPI0012A790F8|nr:hypothetical protein [uncultured Roseibium sp.]QFT34433.1 hypothetical protein FIV00_28315 [Labrenzia sp. THAF82]